jgi:hypothetical protein
LGSRIFFKKKFSIFSKKQEKMSGTDITDTYTTERRYMKKYLNASPTSEVLNQHSLSHVEISTSQKQFVKGWLGISETPPHFITLDDNTPPHFITLDDNTPPQYNDDKKNIRSSSIELFKE